MTVYNSKIIVKIANLFFSDLAFSVRLIRTSQRSQFSVLGRQLHHWTNSIFPWMTGFWACDHSVIFYFIWLCSHQTVFFPPRDKVNNKQYESYPGETKFLLISNLGLVTEIVSKDTLKSSFFSRVNNISISYRQNPALYFPNNFDFSSLLSLLFLCRVYNNKWCNVRKLIGSGGQNSNFSQKRTLMINFSSQYFLNLYFSMKTQQYIHLSR